MRYSRIVGCKSEHCGVRASADDYRKIPGPHAASPIITGTCGRERLRRDYYRVSAIFLLVIVTATLSALSAKSLHFNVGAHLPTLPHLSEDGEEKGCENYCARACFVMGGACIVDAVYARGGLWIVNAWIVIVVSYDVLTRMCGELAD